MNILIYAGLILLAALGAAGEASKAPDQKPAAGTEKAKLEQAPAAAAKPFQERLKEAKAEALKSIHSGVEKALQTYPKLPDTIKASLRNKSMHQQWLEHTLQQTRQQIAKLEQKDKQALTQDTKEELQLNALRMSWTEDKVVSWITQSLYKNEVERLKAEEASSDSAQKKKTGGQNTAPPNGGVMGVGGAGGIGITTQ